jgi:hypothetical protein
MLCLHPHCPMGKGLSSWTDVVQHPDLKIKPKYHTEILCFLSGIGALENSALPIHAPDITKTAFFKRLLRACPCLYAQLDEKVTPKGVVHLCEVTLGLKITSENVYNAFEIQHPSINTHSYLYPPTTPGASGGEIMEQLCSEVLSNHDIPHMDVCEDKWPQWEGRRHLSLNSGKMTSLKLYGDILIPCAPHNLMISVKSEAARERFIVSGNRLESIGFGFFNDASEFWTDNRMNLLKRWGFIAIYMPQKTLDMLKEKLRSRNACGQATNINGRPLFRPLEEFGSDMSRVAGKLSMTL